jgi:hypothetical protein
VTEFIDTKDQLYALPRAAVVISSAGTLAQRFDTDRGALFGDDRPVRWGDLTLPAVVLWRPDRGVPQLDPPPPPEVDSFDQLLDLPPGCAIRTTVQHVDGHRVFEKHADTRWYPTGGARPTPIERLELMLPARLIWHPEWATS